MQMEELYSLDSDSLQAIKCGWAQGDGLQDPNRRAAARGLHSALDLAASPQPAPPPLFPPVLPASCPRRPIYGLIFLFKWVKEADDRAVDADYEARGVFFANQVGGSGWGGVGCEGAPASQAAQHAASMRRRPTRLLDSRCGRCACQQGRSPPQGKCSPGEIALTCGPCCLPPTSPLPAPPFTHPPLHSPTNGARAPAGHHQRVRHPGDCERADEPAGAGDRARTHAAARLHRWLPARHERWARFE